MPNSALCDWTLNKMTVARFVGAGSSLVKCSNGHITI
jgi:hypothetical protein